MIYGIHSENIKSMVRLAMMYSSGEYPRILIVGCDVVPGTGTGVTLSCLFKGWPRDRIAIIAHSRNLGKSDFAGKYYRIGSSEDRWVWPFSMIHRESWKVSGPVYPHSRLEKQQRDQLPQLHSDSKSHLKVMLKNFSKRVFHTVLDFSGATDLVRGLHLSGSLMSWITDYKPDIIYSLLGSLDLVRFLGDLGDETCLPIVLHFMDDWPSVFRRQGFMAPIARRRLESELKSLVAKAAVVMAISDEMSQEYERRYQRSFLTFHNAIDLNDWLQNTERSWKAASPMEVLYAGRINTIRSSSLVDVAQAIDVASKSGLKMRFTIVTPDYSHPIASRLKQLQCVEITQAIPHDDIPARLAKADILVLPLGFGDVEQQFARYSMPTKTVEYLASGTPMVVYAPSKHAVSKYVKSENCAVTVGVRDIETLAEAFLSLANSIEKRESLGHRAVEVVNANHNAITVRKSFQKALCTASHLIYSALSLIFSAC